MTTMTGEQPTAITLTFDHLYVLTSEDDEGGVDVFALNWNEAPTPPPYYITVDDRRFAFTGETFLVRGHGAWLPRFVRGHEDADRLTLFVEREERLLAYVHDPLAEAEAEAEAAADAGEATGTAEVPATEAPATESESSQG